MQRDFVLFGSESFYEFFYNVYYGYRLYHGDVLHLKFVFVLILIGR